MVGPASVVLALGTAIALLSKESGVVVAPLAVLVVLVRRSPGSTSRALSIGVATSAVVGLYLLVRWQVLGGWGGVPTDGERSFATFASVGLHFALESVQVVLAPLHAAWQRTHGWTLGVVQLVLWGVAAAVVGVQRPRAVLALGLGALAWTWIAIAPGLGRASLLADFQSTRYLYAASVGACIALGGLVALARDPGRLEPLLHSVRPRTSPDESARPHAREPWGAVLQRRPGPRRAVLPDPLLWRRLRGGVATVAALGLVALWTVQTGRVNRNWVEAGKGARTLVEAWDGARHGAAERFLVAGVPDNLDGAYVFRCGFAEALALYAAEDRPVEVLPPNGRTPGAAPALVQVRWSPSTGRWTDPGAPGDAGH